LETCGPLCEGRPFFRFLAGELARALADVEAQCTFGLAAGGVGADCVYVAEGGARVTLRGVRWAAPIQPHAPSAAAELEERAAELLRSFGRVMRAVLPPAPAHAEAGAGAGAGEHGAHGAPAEAPPPPPRTLSLAEAQHGVELFVGEEVVVEDEGGGGDEVDDDTVWLPHMTPAALPGGAGEGAGEGEGAGAGAFAGTGEDAAAPALAASARWRDAGGAARAGAACPAVVVAGATVGEAVLWLHGVRGAAAAAAAAAGAAPFARAPPPLEAVAASRRVGVRVSAREPSPTLAALVEAADPRLEDSAAVATVRLLTALLAPGARGAPGAAFARVARELAAVLEFNGAPAAPGGAAGAEGEGAHDADALAALVAALEEADAALPVALGGGAGGDEGSAGAGLRLGAVAARAAARAVRWVSHLARHPFLAEPVDAGAVAADFLAWTAPLRRAQRRAAAALEADAARAGAQAAAASPPASPRRGDDEGLFLSPAPPRPRGPFRTMVHLETPNFGK